MSDGEHRILAEVLHSVKGKVALSGYHSPLMRQLYSDWHYIEAPERLVHSVKMPRTEVLWTNYESASDNLWQERICEALLQAQFTEQVAFNLLP
jgi:DNA adenine methylase